MLLSENRDSGTPIPWGALSGLAADIKEPSEKGIFYTVEDKFYAKSRIFKIDTSATSGPPRITAEIQMKDTNSLLSEVDNAYEAALVNEDMTINIDPEGVAIDPNTGLWVCSEGKGSYGDSNQTPNLLLKVDMEGNIEDVVLLPDDVQSMQIKYGFEGCAFGSGMYSSKIAVGFQRAWTGEDNARLGVYDTMSKSWSFYYYPLDEPTSQNGGWVGISDIAPLADEGKFLILERDNQRGPDAAIKKVYMIDLGGETTMTVVTKTLLFDLVAGGVLTPTNGVLPEKLEGLAVDQDGKAWILTDNDGVGEKAGETLFFPAFDTDFRPLFPYCWTTYSAQDQICKRETAAGMFLIGRFRRVENCQAYCLKNELPCKYIEFLSRPVWKKGRCVGISESCNLKAPPNQKDVVIYKYGSCFA